MAKTGTNASSDFSTVGKQLRQKKTYVIFIFEMSI